MIYYKGTTFTKQRHIGVIVLAKYAMNVSVPNDLAFEANTKTPRLLQSCRLQFMFLLGGGGFMASTHFGLVFHVCPWASFDMCIGHYLINICKGVKVNGQVSV